MLRRGGDILRPQINKMLEGLYEACDKAALISETDAAGTITYVNDNLVKVSKYSREELSKKGKWALN